MIRLNSGLRDNFRPEKADFKLEKADFRSGRADFRLERVNLWHWERERGDGWIDGWKGVQTHGNSHLCSTEHQPFGTTVQKK